MSKLRNADMGNVRRSRCRWRKDFIESAPEVGLLVKQEDIIRSCRLLDSCRRLYVAVSGNENYESFEHSSYL